MNSDSSTNVVMPAPHGPPCPSCGHCPTCGRGGYRAYPWAQPYTWGPIWISTPQGGTSITYSTEVTPLNQVIC